MKRTSRFTVAMTATILCLFLTGTWAAPAKPKIQIAILLDTSNSMDGLIDQARTQLWRVVNEFATAKRDGAKPELQVALYEYGNDGLPEVTGHMRLVVPLTTDLDKVSEELFALKTNGGDEFCGRVIEKAVGALAWSASNNDFKAIFIAGNEPFTQGSMDYRKSCKTAISKGIVVNTIFCGEKQEGINTNWKDGADLADGRYMNIDQNYKPPEIAAPQDKEIARLGEDLNKTYIAYGARGGEGKQRQEAQDVNAAKAAPSASAQRQVAKAQTYYTNASWDLVDAKKEGAVDLDKIDVKDLPPEMQKMTPDQRKAYVDQKRKEREKIQSQINQLGEERKKYVAEALRKQAQTNTNTLDQAVIGAVRDEASAKGFKFQ